MTNPPRSDQLGRSGWANRWIACLKSRSEEGSLPEPTACESGIRGGRCKRRPKGLSGYRPERLKSSPNEVNRRNEKRETTRRANSPPTPRPRSRRRARTVKAATRVASAARYSHREIRDDALPPSKKKKKLRENQQAIQPSCRARRLARSGAAGSARAPPIPAGVLQAAPLDCFASLAMTGWELTKGRIFSHRFRARRRFSRRSERGLVGAADCFASLAMTGWELTKGRIFSRRFRARCRFSRRSERGVVRNVTVLASSRLTRCGPASRGLVETERRARHFRHGMDAPEAAW